MLEERSFSPSVYHVFPVRFDDRDVATAVLKEWNVETGLHYSPAVHQHPAWEGHAIRCGDVPCAEAWAAEELSLPMHPRLTRDEIEQVVAAVHAVVERQ
jgi:dTDP-4-amino-4,6-dideoxygalactose transaminase